MMTMSLKLGTAAVLIALIFSGCTGKSDAGPTGSSDEQQVAPPLETSAAAGAFNGTVLTMVRDGIKNTTVLYARFASTISQKCEASFQTSGTAAQPSAYGWSLAMSPTRTWYAHEMIAEAVVNAEAGDFRPSGSTSTYVEGASRSTITLDAEDEISFIVVGNYPPTETSGEGGQVDFEVHCPGGMTDLVTGWSETAHLFSDVSMNGTWASLHVKGTGRWGSQPLVDWSADLPERSTMFVATEPVAGRATLVSSSGEMTCGPSMKPDRAMRGRALCMHEYGGGETALKISQSAMGRVGQSGTSDSWMGLIAQMDYYDWTTQEVADH